MQPSITISFNEPTTGKVITRIYKFGIGENYNQALLSIVRALNFIYERQIKFRIDERPGKAGVNEEDNKAT